MTASQLIKYECPKCDHKVAAVMFVGGPPECPKHGAVMKKVT